jgi:hypothetical protein
MLNLSVDHILVVRPGHNHFDNGPSRYASIYKPICESSAELIAMIGSSPPFHSVCPNTSENQQFYVDVNIGGMEHRSSPIPP